MDIHNVSPQHKVTPWKVLSSTPAFKEKWFPIRRDVVELPTGKVIDDYFVWESPDIAMAVPLTTDGKFVVVRQYRHAINKIMYQFPAGAVDKGETPQQAAIRELEEETGYIATSDPVRLAHVSPYATKTTGLLTLYFMHAEASGTAHFDDQEITEVVLMAPEELRAIISKPDLLMESFYFAALLGMQHIQSKEQS